MNVIHHHVKGTEPNHEHHKNQPTGWYFWDETWGDRIGPFDSMIDAERNLQLYCRLVLGEKEDYVKL